MIKPKIFISSTCRDLTPQRDCIISRLNKMGLTPIYSESPNFPIRHGLTAKENCYSVVDLMADVMILVLGKSYGSVDTNGRSVTHNEYLQAKFSGIPVIILVDKGLIDLIPIVKSNPSIDLSSQIDRKELFEFIDNLLSDDQRWIFPYSRLDEIEDIVIQQLGVLFGECLSLYKKLQASKESNLIELMGPASRRIYLNKDKFWEFDLLESLLREYFSEPQLRFKELENKYGYVREALILDEDDLNRRAVSVEFLGSINRIRNLTENWKILINLAMNDAIGAPGVEGDASKLVFTARRLADLYSEFLDEYNCMIRYSRYNIMEKSTNAYINLFLPALEYLGSTPKLWQDRVKKIKESVTVGLNSVDMSFELPEGDFDSFKKEFQKLATEMNH